MYLAIAAALDDHTTEWATIHRHGIARHFPVHITIKGRFIVAETTSLVTVVENIERVFRVPAFAVQLDGPIYIGGTLRWLECLPNRSGHREITALHQACVERILGADYADYCAPGAFELGGYRPHVTLDWSEGGILVPDPERISESISITARVERWILMRYTGDRYRRGVEVVHSAAFETGE